MYSYFLVRCCAVSGTRPCIETKLQATKFPDVTNDMTVLRAFTTVSEIMYMRILKGLLNSCENNWDNRYAYFTIAMLMRALRQNSLPFHSIIHEESGPNPIRGYAHFSV
jgi:hypothetical protein